MMSESPLNRWFSLIIIYLMMHYRGTLKLVTSALLASLKMILVPGGQPARPGSGKDRWGYFRRLPCESGCCRPLNRKTSGKMKTPKEEPSNFQSLRLVPAPLLRMTNVSRNKSPAPVISLTTTLISSKGGGVDVGINVGVGIGVSVGVGDGPTRRRRFLRNLRLRRQRGGRVKRKRRFGGHKNRGKGGACPQSRRPGE